MNSNRMEKIAKKILRSIIVNRRTKSSIISMIRSMRGGEGREEKERKGGKERGKKKKEEAQR